MAILYPRALPPFLKATETVLSLRKGTSSGLTRGGGVQVVQHSEAYWDFQWTTQPLTRVQLAEFQAWWDSLRGGLKTFLAHDPFNSYPDAYASEAAVLALTRSGGGTFDGTFGLTTILANEVRSSGAALRPPAGLTLSAGDLISLSQSGKYSLHRITETVTANGSGNFQSTNAILVEPAISTATFTAAGAVANVIKPLAEFVPDENRLEAVQQILPTAAVFAGFSKMVI